MPVPTHFKFTFRGIFNNSPEQWSFGAHFKRDVGSAEDSGVDDINQGAVTSALSALMQNVGMGGDVWATDWRAYEIGTNGKMQNNPLLVDVSSDTSCRGNSTNRFPPQIATCITLVANNRGPARYGRFYLPGPSASMASDWRMTEANAAAIAETVTTFLKSVADSIDLTLPTTSSECLNVSVRGGADGTKQTVDHVEVGRVFDTIRSRRNKLLEERHVHGHIDW